MEMEDDDPFVSESDSDEDVRLSEPSTTAVNNEAGLLDKLADISWPEHVEWIHKLSFDIDQENEVNANDDLNRELAFYTQGLEGARQAFTVFQSTGVPFIRPPDFYAEMDKSDAHMGKAKGLLLAEKRKVEDAEERRKAREADRLSREAQVQKQMEEAVQKEEDKKSVKKWRKPKKQSGLAGNDKDGDLSLASEDGKSLERSSKKRPGVTPGDRTGGKGKQYGGKGKKGFDNKRGREDSKFGFGGKKGMKKQNTAETTNGFRGHSKSNFSKNKKQKV